MKVVKVLTQLQVLVQGLGKLLGRRLLVKVVKVLVKVQYMVM